MNYVNCRQPDRGSGRRPIVGRIPVAVAIAACSLVASVVNAAFDPGRAAFSLTINDDLVVPFRVFAIYVLPGERLEIAGSEAIAAADAENLAQTSTGRWTWVAPMNPGAAALIFTDGLDEIRLNAVILHPASEVRDGSLLDYRIGAYPAPLRGDRAYLPPDGFIELTADLLDLQLSPHFSLRQFPSKQSTALPKFLVLRESLLLKLELLLERVNEAGVETDAFTVMSGYRTPMYNRSIGNGQHSRHIYGGAADIYIDVAPRDDIMDDLNRDGRSDFRDAQWLYRIADELFSRPDNRQFRGGLGVYRSTSTHGPFLHVDARGVRARWGLIPD
jgi:hypothetical protein